MRIEVWSDVVCPWCYIGKRRLDDAIASSGEEVEVVFRSFELDPGAPQRADGAVLDMLATRYGVSAEESASMQDRVAAVAADTGLDYHLDLTRHGSSRAAHRLLHLALESGGASTQAALVEAVMAAYFTRGLDITDHDVLAGLAAGAGVPEDRAREVLDGSGYDDAVAADVETGRALGVQGVPFFVADRALALSGAQPPEVFARFLAQAAEAASQQAGT